MYIYTCSDTHTHLCISLSHTHTHSPHTLSHSHPPTPSHTHITNTPTPTHLGEEEGEDQRSHIPGVEGAEGTVVGV